LSQASFRGPGQALAALWQGAPIGHVDIDGIALDWYGERICHHASGQLKIEIAIGLTGIATQGSGGCQITISWVRGNSTNAS
jgi:hypothetical protein